jgi:F-type H+-transporting ATPase subunit b
MLALAVQATTGSGRIQEVARTFGVDWPHLAAQIVSFAIVCAVLYALAYKPILRMLEARRQQIASGLANAEKIRSELARIDGERRTVLARADATARQLIEDAHAAAMRVESEETRRALAAADRILVTARESAQHDRARLIADVKRDLGRLVVRTAAAATGKVLTADDQRRLVEETARQLKTSDENSQNVPTHGTPPAPVVLRR